MTIPDIRDRLHALADEHGIPELHELAEATRRRSYRRTSSRRYMRPGMADAIRAYKRANPDVPEWDIAVLFGVNQGRVSVALHGPRS